MYEKIVTSMSHKIQGTRKMGFQLRQGSSCVKSPSKCTECHRPTLKRKHVENCADALSCLETEGGFAMKIVLQNNKTGAAEMVDLKKKACVVQKSNNVYEEELKIVNMMHYVKDKFNVSGLSLRLSYFYPFIT